MVSSCFVNGVGSPSWKVDLCTIKAWHPPGPLAHQQATLSEQSIHLRKQCLGKFWFLRCRKSISGVASGTDSRQRSIPQNVRRACLERILNRHVCKTVPLLYQVHA